MAQGGFPAGAGQPDKLKPWLVRILVNECHEVLRRRKREIPTETLPEESAPPPQEQRGTPLPFHCSISCRE